jgi:hypothetical protein
MSTQAQRNACNMRRYRLNRAFVDSFKNRPCADCWAWFEPCQMDFDHRPGTNKKHDVASYLVNASRKDLIAEIAKCDVVCANCHRLRTQKRLDKKRFLCYP